MKSTIILTNDNTDSMFLIVLLNSKPIYSYYVESILYLLLNTYRIQNSINIIKMEKLLSVKGKPILLHDSYIYTVERTAETKLILRCKKRDCKGKLILNIRNQPIKIIFFDQLSTLPH